MNCQNFECWAIPTYLNYITFPTEDGATYYCIVYGGDQTSRVTMKCIDETINNTCDKAISISCADSAVPLDFTNTFQLDSAMYNPSSLWYQI